MSSLSMTPDGKELVVATSGTTVTVYTNSGGQFVANLTINLPGFSYKRVKVNHKCLAVAEKENSYVVVYRWNGRNLVLSQNITVGHP